MKQHFNTGERRGLIVVITILSIIIAATFLTRQCNGNKTEANVINNDSIVTILRSKVEAQKSTQSKEWKTKAKKEKKQSSKKNQNKKSNNNFVERDPLNETLPTNQ
ncbi:MAG: hypothetical protein E7081_09690 [Bacteroidales bacterium]|nr:hypothetical protein [Bacteroidales bacterium]